MKKRISMLLVGSLVAISLAGCSGNTATPETSVVPSDSSVESNANPDVSSNSDTKSDGSSKTDTSKAEAPEDETSDEIQTEPSDVKGPEEGDIVIDESGNEIILHESDVSIDDESMPVTSDEKEELPFFLDVTYTPIDVKDSNVEVDVINMNDPQYYLINSKTELDDFVSKYEKTFSLNDVEDGIEFNTLAEKFDDTYFENMSVVVIPVEYDKDTETEIGTITIDGNNYVIEVCTQPAATPDKVNRLCFVVQTYKSDMEDKNILIKVIEDAIIEDYEEEEI